MRTLITRAQPLLDLLAQLGPGSRLLLLRIIGRFGWKTALIALVVALYTASRYRTWIAWGVAAWCAAALAQKPEPEERTEDGVDEAPAGPDPRDVVDLVRDLIGDDRGALLTTLRSPLHAADTRAVREVLAAANIRVRDGVRTGGGNGPGVHRNDLPPLPPPPAETPVGGVVAGERANNKTANALRVESREGMTIITDPADRHRTYSLKKP